MMIRLLLTALAAMTVSGCIQHEESHHETEGSITVAGKATVQRTPDTANLRMGVQAKAATLKEAQADVDGVAAAFLALAKKLGIDDKDVQTVSITARPEYRWNQKDQTQTLIGYAAERSFNVTLKELGNLAPLMEQAVDAGVNQISPPTLSSSQADEAYREALQLAAKDAKANAKALAKALDVEIDDVIAISSTATGVRPQPMMRSSLALAEDSGGRSSYTVGEIDYQVSVTATFEIEDD